MSLGEVDAEFGSFEKCGVCGYNLDQYDSSGVSRYDRLPSIGYNPVINVPSEIAPQQFPREYWQKSVFTNCTELDNLCLGGYCSPELCNLMINVGEVCGCTEYYSNIDDSDYEIFGVCGDYKSAKPLKDATILIPIELAPVQIASRVKPYFTVVSTTCTEIDNLCLTGNCLWELMDFLRPMRELCGCPYRILQCLPNGSMMPTNYEGVPVDGPGLVQRCYGNEMFDDRVSRVDFLDGRPCTYYSKLKPDGEPWCERSLCCTKVPNDSPVTFTTDIGPTSRTPSKTFYIDLYDQGIASIPDDIGRLTLLTSLGLSGNLIKSIPSEIGRLTALTYLDLSFNSITSIPTTIGLLENLEYFRIMDNSIESIPSEIGLLTALTDLDLGYNSITSIPSEIASLSALKRLYLYEDNINIIPSEIGLLAALTDLHLGYNSITSIPSEIASLSALKRLDLYFNDIKFIPSEIGLLVALTSLELAYNSITSIPSEIARLSALKMLDLNGNDIKFIPSEIGLLVALRSLDLAYNSISSIPSEIARLSALVALRLEGNDYTSIPCELAQLPFGGTKVFDTVPVGFCSETSPPTSTPTVSPTRRPTNHLTKRPTSATSAPSDAPTDAPIHIVTPTNYSNNTSTANPTASKTLALIAVGVPMGLLVIILAVCLYSRGRMIDGPKDEQGPSQDPTDEEIPNDIVVDAIGDPTDEEIPIDIVVDAIVDDGTDEAPTNQTAYATRVGILEEELPAVAEPVAEQLGWEEQVAVEPLAVLADSIIPESENGTDYIQK